MKAFVPAKEFLTSLERGCLTSTACAATQQHWTLKTTAELGPSCQGRIQYVRGQEDYFVCLTAAGAVYFYGLTRLLLSEPQERVIKFLLTHELILISVTGTMLLRFSKYDLSSLQNGQLRREDYLPELSLKLSALKQVDFANQCIVIQDEGSVAVWDLQTGSQIGAVSGQFGVSVWYSNRHLIELFNTHTHKVLTISNLSDSRVRQCKLPLAAQLIQAQVCGQSIALVFRNCPVQILDLATGTLRSIGSGVPRLVLEAEMRSDALVSFANGLCYLLSCPDSPIELAVRKPVFTDIGELVAVVENNICTVISREGKVLDVFPVDATCQVTALSINEDTWEIYAVCDDDKVRIYH